MRGLRIIPSNWLHLGAGVGIGAFGGSPWSLQFDFSTAPDGALPVQFTGPTFAISGGKLHNTPGLGTELLSNGDMETGNPPTGWSAGGTSTLTGVADERTGGAGAQSLNIARGTSDNAATKTTTSGQVGWHRASAWLKNINATLVNILPLTNSPTNNSTSWHQHVVTGLVTPAAAITMRLRGTGAAGVQYRGDDASIKKITVGNLFATFDAGLSDFNMVCPAMPDAPGGTQIGAAVCINADATGYVVVFYFNNLSTATTTIEVVSLVSGTYATLSSTTVSYGATKYISLKKTGDQLSVFYGTSDFGTQVGSAVTVPAGLTANTKHGLFATCELVGFTGAFKFGRYTP